MDFWTADLGTHPQHLTPVQSIPPELIVDYQTEWLCQDIDASLRLC